MGDVVCSSTKYDLINQSQLNKCNSTGNNWFGERMQKSNVPMELGGLDPRYECPICLSCFKDPILTSCGHKFCCSCLNLWLETKGGCCPVDGAKLNRSSDLFPDHFTKREILSQRTMCTFCNLEMSINELEEHLITHSEHPEETNKKLCPFKSIGCEMEVHEERLNEHLESEIHHHLCLLKNSHEKLLDKVKGNDKISEALAQEALLWEPQEKGKEQRSASLMRALYERVIILEQGSHEQNAQIQKLQDKVKSSDKMSEALAQDALLWEPQEKGKEQRGASLMRALYERVIVLEQRCHQQNAQIDKLKADVREADVKLRQSSLQHACGQYLWSITEFSKKVAAMRSGDRRLFFSDGFYTSPIGYKICGRINLSPINGDQLSLLIHLMKSPFDGALDWPFTGRIHLAVIHPTSPEMSVKETMMTRPELDAFKRPQREMNTKAFGYPQFISLNDVFKNGFLTDDTLLVKIHIQCV